MDFDISPKQRQFLDRVEIKGRAAEFDGGKIGLFGRRGAKKLNLLG